MLNRFKELTKKIILKFRNIFFERYPENSAESNLDEQLTSNEF